MRSVVSKRAGRLAVACALSAAAFGLRYLFAAELHLPGGFLVFFPAVFLSTWWGDTEGGLLAIALTTVGAGWYIDPGDIGWSLEARNVIALTLFAGVGLMVVVLTGRLRESLIARDYLLSMAAHDVKSPLSTAKLQLQLLGRVRADGRGPSSQEIAQGLALIDRSIDGAVFLVDNLLDLGRIERGALRLERSEVDLSVLVCEVVEGLRPRIERGGYEVTVEGIERERMGEWDALGLRRVVENLLSNALKYGEGRPIELHVGGDHDRGWFSVRDHGSGVPPDFKRRVFEPFRHAARSDQMYTSHGLGLWIVRSLVDAHGGRLTVDSAPGGGSLFRVELPRRMKQRHRDSVDLVASR